MAIPNRSIVIRRVSLRNFKSIRRCDVELHPLSILVGPNASGKSNFLDALRFVKDALDAGDRPGALGQVPPRNRTMPRREAVVVELAFDMVPTGRTVGSPLGHGTYRLALNAAGARTPDMTVAEEACEIVGADGESVVHLAVHAGMATVWLGSATAATEVPVAADRLFLATANQPDLAELRGLLARAEFYEIDPTAIVTPKGCEYDAHVAPEIAGGRSSAAVGEPPYNAASSRLRPSGDNLTRVLGRMIVERPAQKDRLERYLTAIAPAVEHVTVEGVGADQTLLFLQRLSPRRKRYGFFAADTSRGTLGALGVLTALFQPVAGDASATIVGIEEPEMALHPAAAGVLFDAITEASESRQVIITTHSADLLDNANLDTDSVLAVAMEDGATVIGPVDAASRQIVRDGLYSLGQLMREGQIEPAADAAH